MTYKDFIQNILDTRGRFSCGEEYHERHHIIPKCLGGENDDDNLIDLFAREHFIAHKLLAEENPDNKSLLHAWTMMAWAKNEFQIRYEVTPEEYEKAKISHSNSLKGKNNPMYGKHNTPEQKIAQSSRVSGENNPMYGVHLFGEKNGMYGRRHTDDSRDKMSKSQKERMKNSENNPMYGKHHSKDTKTKIRESKRNIFKAVFCVELNEIFESTTLPERKYNIDHYQIIKCCQGRAKSAGKHPINGCKLHWKYVYDYVTKDGSIIPGAITLGLITEKETL